MHASVSAGSWENTPACLHLSIPQVLDWVEQHGEVFLNKHSGVGKSLHRARALQKRHDDFQQVAQVGNLEVKRRLASTLQFRDGLNSPEFHSPGVSGLTMMTEI